VGSLLGKNGLNLIINNAAVLPSKSMWTTNVEDMHQAFNTNVLGPLFVIRVMERVFGKKTNLRLDLISCNI